MGLLTIFEGPDCSGKTTTIDKLIKLNKLKFSEYEVYHHGPYLGDTKEELVNRYIKPLKNDNGKEIFYDRSWVSEIIYGKIIRGISRFSKTDILNIENSIYNLHPTMVLCMPPIETIIKTYENRIDTEYVKKEKQIIKIYNDYSLIINNPRIPIVEYDYTKNTIEYLDKCIKGA